MSGTHENCERLWAIETPMTDKDKQARLTSELLEVCGRGRDNWGNAASPMPNLRTWTYSKDENEITPKAEMRHSSAEPIWRCKALVTRGADVNGKSPEIGATPLHNAAEVRTHWRSDVRTVREESACPCIFAPQTDNSVHGRY